MKTLPADVVSYRRTEEFSESTAPRALRSRHSTKRGVWARITLVSGSLLYCILEPRPEEHLLSSERPGIVEPEKPHRIEVVGPVRFYVEFFRRPG